MTKTIYYAPLLTISSLLLVSQAGAAVTPIDHCGFQISQPGEYHVTQDLVCPSGGDAIIITASNVELHFDGHTLDGNGNGGNGVSAAYQSNVSIFGNGAIKGFGNAQINFFRTDNSRIVNMTTSNGTGIFGGGINIQACTNDTLTNCTANDNPSFGIAVGGGGNNTLTSNTANGNGNSPSLGHGGIVVFQSGNNVFLANTTNDNFKPGINVYASPFSVGNLFQANKAHNNAGFDLFDGNSCGSNTWKSNQNGTSNQSCIQ